jgi:hypothetical protein
VLPGAFGREPQKTADALRYIKAHYRGVADTESELMINRVIEISQAGDPSEYEWPPAH